MVALSVPFWLIFEAYNLYDFSWQYVHFSILMHLVNFTTIMPALLETFSLFNVMEVGKRLDSGKSASGRKRYAGGAFPANGIWILVAAGLLVSLLPFAFPSMGFLFMWIGLFLLIDPIDYLTGRPSIVKKLGSGQRSIVVRLFMSGMTMGLFWEFWNYQAYPKWTYTISIFLSNVKLFEMPILGYIGYLPFAMEAFLFYALFRSFFFKKGNELLSM